MEPEGPFTSKYYIVKTFVMLLYFSTSTITSVGYGDIYPRTWYLYLICSSQMLIGVVYVEMCLFLFFFFSSPWMCFLVDFICGVHALRSTAIMHQLLTISHLNFDHSSFFYCCHAPISRYTVAILGRGLEVIAQGAYIGGLKIRLPNGTDDASGGGAGHRERNV